MSKKKKSKKENPESVWPINEKMINPEVVYLYGPPKASPSKKKLKKEPESPSEIIRLLNEKNEKLKIPPEMVTLYGPPKDLPCKKSKKTKNEKDDKEK